MSIRNEVPRTRPPLDSLNLLDPGTLLEVLAQVRAGDVSVRFACDGEGSPSMRSTG
jgi:hypothetical protein